MSEKDNIHHDEMYGSQIDLQPPATSCTTSEKAETMPVNLSIPLIDKTEIDPPLKEKSETAVPSSVNVTPPHVPTPPDGGYGWFIVLGSFITHIIIGGLERSEGVFFLQFQAKFHENAQLTSWPGAISGSIRLLIGPIATAISNRYSIRTCCMMGSALQFIGTFMNSFAPNFYFLFISHALLVGLGRGLLYAPSLIIVNMYFDKRRSLSVGLAASGVGVGSILVVPLTQLLFDLYGFEGAFLVISAVTCNSFLVAMLFRPLSMHYKFTHRTTDQDSELSSLSHDERNVSANATMLNSSTDVQRPVTESGTHKGQTSNGQCFAGFKDSLAPSFQILFPIEENVNTSTNMKRKKSQVMHFYLLKDPSFLFFCISILLFTAAFKAAFTFVPALVKSKGYTDTEAALVLSIAGVVDTLSRILAGFLFDMSCLKAFRTMIYNALIFALAIISFMLPSLVNYVTFCFVMSLYGSFSGAYVSQKSVITVEVLGVENLAYSFGMLTCFQGVGSAFGPPLSGAFKDAFGTFKEAFYFGGGLMLVAGLIMVTSNIFLRFKDRRNKGRKVTSEE